MSYAVTHRSGATRANFPIERFGELLAELDAAEPEHSGISVTHDSEWSLMILRSGAVILEDLEDDEPLHATVPDRAEQLALMIAVAEGRIDEVHGALSWEPGYPRL